MWIIGRPRLLKLDERLGAEALREALLDARGALEHWAKVEGDSNVQERLKKRLGDDALTRFADARKTYDPQRLLSNPLLDGIFK